MYNAIIFTDITHNIANSIPIGAYKCAHVIRKNGYSCLVVNHLSDYTLSDLQELLDTAIGNNTKLIGFSTTFFRTIVDPKVPETIYSDLIPNTLFPQGKDFENLVIDYIKQKNNNIKILAGGTAVNQHWSNKNVDYVCLGYGETSIVNLMHHLFKGDPLLHTTTNIWGVKIIDDRFAKSYDFPNEDMIWLDTDVVNHQVLPVEVGRGCIFKCKFCSFALNGKQQLDFIKTADLIRLELQDNYDKFGITKYIIVDDTFNDHPDKLKLILSAIKQLNFQPTFWAYTRLDLLATRPETLPILYEIGLRNMYFGIETLNEKAGRIIGKGYNRIKQIEMIKYIRKTYPDISLHGSFIVGLPEESIEDVTDTFNKLCNQEIPLHSWQFSGLKIYEQTAQLFNSEFTDNYSKYGYINQGSNGKVISWTNNFMDSATAAKLATQFMAHSYTLDHFHIAGLMKTEIGTMGYNISSNFKSFNWNECETVIRPAFIKEYKQKLLKLIKIKVDN